MLERFVRDMTMASSQDHRAAQSYRLRGAMADAARLPEGMTYYHRLIDFMRYRGMAGPDMFTGCRIGGVEYRAGSFDPKVVYEMAHVWHDLFTRFNAVPARATISVGRIECDRPQPRRVR